MLHKGNNHSQMYLWHNHQRTLWFERLHSEKPTNFYNLMSQNMSGRELPRLYDPAWVHVKKLTTELSECIWLWPESNSWLLPCHFQYEPGGIFDSMCVSLAWTVLEPREFANQRITAHKLLYVGKVWHWEGGGVVDWDSSDREIMKNIRVVMIQNRETLKPSEKKKKLNQNTKPHSSTPVNRSR